MIKGVRYYRNHELLRKNSSFLRAIRRKKRKKKMRGCPNSIKNQIKFNRKYWDFVKIKAPNNFSIVENEEGTLGFIREIKESYGHKKKTFINLHSITHITNDALLLLLSNMVRFRAKRIPFDGNFPKNKNCRRIVMNSGFLESLYDDIKSDNSYYLQGRTCSFHTHANKRVDQKMTDIIIEKAAQTIWGEPRRCPKVQRTFIELMQNTNNHAADIQGGKHWWLSVSHDPINKKVVMSFLDFGKGIFRSLEGKKPEDKFYHWREVIKKYWPLVKSNDKKFELILQGALYKDQPVTVTRDYKRGKGLPGIYTALQKNDIQNLVIITNNVYANVSKNDYHVMSNEFDGTFVSWEMNESINSLPWM